MELRERLLREVPDEPGYVDTRGVLLEGAAVFGDLEGWVAVRLDRRLLIAGGRPQPAVIAVARAEAHPEAEALASGPAVALLEAALGREATRAIVHRVGEGGLVEPADLRDAVLLEVGAPLTRFHPEVRREISELPGSRPVGAVLRGAEPVAVCYPTLVTERYWDVSIETAEGYRRAGRATAAFFRVEREMRAGGRQPVWGAAENNPASLGLAAKLGFVPAAEVGWFE